MATKQQAIQTKKRYSTLCNVEWKTLGMFNPFPVYPYTRTPMSTYCVLGPIGYSSERFLLWFWTPREMR
jgi:hypothetical protein